MIILWVKYLHKQQNVLVKFLRETFFFFLSNFVGNKFTGISDMCEQLKDCISCLYNEFRSLVIKQDFFFWLWSLTDLNLAENPCPWGNMTPAPTDLY